MRGRILLALCVVVSTGACVKLDKPENVAECAATNSCVNAPKDLDGGVTKDGGGYIDGPQRADADTARPGLDGASLPLDGAATTDDGPPVDDDAPPVIVPDAADDLPVPNGDDVGPVPPDSPSDQPLIDNPDAGEEAAPPPDTKDAYRDVAAGICAPGGVVQPAGTVCRAAVGLCDVDETCDGVTADCPADKFAAAGKECRAAAGDCDIAEACSGTSADCPVDGFKQLGTVCRAAAGDCDLAESCTGTTAGCPLDSLASSTTICRASTDGNKCDPAENCAGTSTSCPSNLTYTAPAAPAGVTATAGTLQATIAWSASAGATGYNVKRSITSGSGYTTLASSPTTSASPYTDSGLTGGTTYYYVISAINTVSTCESADSSEESATPAGLCTPPAAPAVTATPGDGIVTLAWAAVAGAVSYSVARSETTGTGYATIASVTTGTGYTDSDVDNGTTYYYVVTSSNGSCSSVTSIEASASPACTPPAPPTNLQASAGDGSATLTFAASAGATSYAILRNTTGTPPWNFTVNTTTQTTFTDDTVDNGTTYYFVVRASNGRCSSDNSAVVSVIPVCTPPSSPTGVTATVGDKQISLSWTAPAGATSYRVSRGASAAGPFTEIATRTTTSYTNTGLTNGTTYYYVVAASNGSCWSANSTPATPATPVCTPPSVPGTPTATAGDAKVTLSWAASTPTPTSYTVQRKTGSGGTYATIATPTTNSYVDDTPPLTNGTTYYYKVSAYNGSCSSTFGGEGSATPQPTCTQGAPGTPTATITSSTQVKLDWTAAIPAPSGGYNIGRSPSATGSYTSVGSVASGVLTFTDPATGLTIGATYYYQITAIGSTCSTTSAARSVTLTCSTPAAPATVTATNNNSNGQITVTWSTSTGATGYTVLRGTASGGPFTTLSTNQSSATYLDTPPTPGVSYYYVVKASNAAGACTSANSTAVGSAMSCTIAAAPAGLSARRSGNRQVTLVWTNSSGATSYNVLRSTTSGSGYQSIGTVGASPYTDTTAANGTVYYYVVNARTDAGGNCASANSAQVAVPSCTVVTGGGSSQKQDDRTQWCLVTCDDVQWWGYSGGGDRTLYINNVQTSTSGALPLPAKRNGGYAFYFTASANNDPAEGDYTYWNYGHSGTPITCP